MFLKQFNSSRDLGEYKMGMKKKGKTFYGMWASKMIQIVLLALAVFGFASLMWGAYEAGGVNTSMYILFGFWGWLTAILIAFCEYMLFKDHCNNKSNQKNLGTIKCSNLCTEIVEYTAPDEIAVCNLASISLSKLTTPAQGYDESGAGFGGKFDFDKLKEISMVVTRNLNRVIERNFYPREECKR
jgi:hypothetical protein